MDLRYFGDVHGIRLELGTGAGFIKTLYPDVITSDVKPLPHVDLVAKAQCLPIRSAAVRAIYAINVFHHVSDPRAYFREVLRVLLPGGGVVMIEPYHGAMARLVYRRLFTMESFNPDARGWANPTSGPASGANQALSYIVFKRDRKLFEEDFPVLRIIADEPHSNLAYLASGGVNFRQLLPDRIIVGLLCLEKHLPWLRTGLSFLHTIVLRKER
jgi:SAM-dependent methyltransferase